MKTIVVTTLQDVVSEKDDLISIREAVDAAYQSANATIIAFDDFTNPELAAFGFADATLIDTLVFKAGSNVIFDDRTSDYGIGGDGGNGGDGGVAGDVVGHSNLSGRQFASAVYIT